MKVIDELNKVSFDNIDIYNGDCLEVMEYLASIGVKVDAVITDPPYGTTACKWDSVIPFNQHIIVKKGKKEIPMYDKDWILNEAETTYKSVHECREEFYFEAKEGMWDKIKKIRKDNSPIVLFGSEPFSSALRMSNSKEYKYDWIWNKDKATNHLNAKKMPMRKTELISVFCLKSSQYYPQFKNKEPKNIRPATTKRKNTGSYGDMSKPSTRDVPITLKYPDNILDFRACFGDKNKSLHETQKPVCLLEYLIKTYTDENDIVLDFTAGSFTTAIACINTNRKFIGIEKDPNYFKLGKERIENHLRKRNPEIFGEDS